MSSMFGPTKSESEEGRDPEAETPSVHNPDDASSGAAPQGNLVTDDDQPRAQQGDPETPNAGDSGRVVRAQQPDHSADEDGYIGVDPVYRNASDNKRKPRPENVSDEDASESE